MLWNNQEFIDGLFNTQEYKTFVIGQVADSYEEERNHSAEIEEAEEAPRRESTTRVLASEQPVIERPSTVVTTSNGSPSLVDYGVLAAGIIALVRLIIPNFVNSFLENKAKRTEAEISTENTILQGFMSGQERLLNQNEQLIANMFAHLPSNNDRILAILSTQASLVESVQDDVEAVLAILREMQKQQQKDN